MAARRTTDQPQTSTSYIYTNAPLDAGSPELRGVKTGPGAGADRENGAAGGAKRPSAATPDGPDRPRVNRFDAGIFDSHMRALHQLTSR
jgi:hypothetical protein